jgi:hypothetical protein
MISNLVGSIMKTFVMSLSAGVVSGLVTLGGAGAAAAADSELWPSCAERPPAELRQRLPLGAEGFVDAGFTVNHAGAEWKALQFTSDREIAAEVRVGSYLRGLIGDDWPANTVDVTTELHAGRLVAVEIDGTLINVTPECLLDLSSDDGELAIYNIWPRFNTTGPHTLKYIWEQKRAFYFVHPFAPADDEFQGRRVFVPGEVSGDPLDGLMIVTYSLTVTD